MKPEEKQEYLESYEEAKKKGIPFFPDALFKDAVVSLAIFIVLVVLATVVGAALDDPADPAAEFDPRPEWYFLFLFQLLKYFPGSIEFLGAVVLPGIVILLLFALPWLDRSKRRHFSGRKAVLGVTVFLLAGAVFLSVQSEFEEPPPSELEAAGDQVALLYTENCSACHAGSIDVPAGMDLVSVIAAGGHEGMPAWSADLSSDEIDALAGFVLSPTGSSVYSDKCSECHALPDLTGVSATALRTALDAGFAPHGGSITLEPTDRTALLNFLLAADGQRLFTLNCSSCHGTAVPFGGSREELREIIERGGGHLDMPAMGGVLKASELADLAAYVVNPAEAPAAAVDLFQEFCAVCHGDRVPASASLEEARATITQGGQHEDMPVWGEILTPEQLNALTDYAFTASRGTPIIAGRELYSQNCTVCHGEFGEGGANPANPLQVIAPISTASYLKTRDDFTIRAIVAQGQPDLGMSPFGLAYGGSLDEEDLDAVVAFIRSWEANPPVELPPEIERAPLAGSAQEVYDEFCAQCHGADGEGGIGPSFQDPDFHTAVSDEELFEIIDLGHSATAMIAWGEVLRDSQIEGLVLLIRTLDTSAEPPSDETPGADVSFDRDILPMFATECGACHGALGNWSAASYADVMETGDNAPVVIPGDPDASLLVRLLQDPGPDLMPPGRQLSDEQIQLVVDWIAAGALDN